MEKSTQALMLSLLLLILSIQDRGTWRNVFAILSLFFAIISVILYILEIIEEKNK